VASLAEHPRYKAKINNILRPAYSVLVETILAHRGKVINGKTIRLLIDSAISGSNGSGRSTILHVHNWTVEKYDNKAKITIDWSKYFDRQSKKVPDAKVWDNKLMPELFKSKDKISKSTPNRHIVCRGRMALSTGIALGVTFPEVGNWSFEIPQPPQTDPWRSDADKIKNYKLKYKVLNPSSFSLKTSDNNIVFIFNITGKALDEVIDYLKTNKIGLKKIIIIEPGKAPGNLSIQNDSEAVSLASAAKDIIKEMGTKYKTGKTHLFFYGPLGLSIFLGQKLTSVGDIQLYEFQNPGYKPSCLIKT
jgi:hypothetical protein